LLWLDPVAAIVVALLIVHAAWKLTVESGRDLLDASLPAEETAWIEEYLRGIGPSVRGFHHLRTRRAGSHRFVEFHLVVDKDLTVEASHHLSDALARAIKARFSGSTVTIHIEPCDGKCRPACIEGCLLTEENRAAVHAQAVASRPAERSPTTLSS
jgi:cation diffusion facilitator family transporter